MNAERRTQNEELRSKTKNLLRSAFFVLRSSFIFFTLGTLGTLLAPPPALAAVPTSQRDALISIYNATGGPNWTRREGWLGAAGTECNWRGVDCDAAGANVAILALEENNLTGSLPAAIGNLTGLRALLLYSNNLSGPLPGEIGKLAALESIYLMRNQFSGNLPRELGSLTKLEYLGLYENAFTGPIPRELGNLTALTDLELGSNKLSGPIPPELAQLANLEILSVAANELTGGIPAGLGRMAKLQWINVADNKLGGTIPAALGDATALTHIYASYSDIGGPIPATLGRLRNLELLELSNNRLTGALPKELGDLAKLTQLHLASNQLSGPIPPELFRATALEAINLGENAFSGEIPREVGSLKALTQFWLHQNALTGPIPIELTTLPALTSLALQLNKLSGPILPELSRLTALKQLNLSTNTFTGTIPASLGGLSSLEALILSSNQLEGPIPPELGSLANLTHLELAANRLSGGVPDTLRKLTHLQSLVLSDNRLAGPFPSWIGELTDLQDLSIGSNRFSGDLPPSIANLTKLVFLQINVNEFTGGLPDFSRMQSLISLRGEVNRLTGPIPASIGATRLVDIYLDGNRLTGPLPRELAKLTSLATLAVGGNAIEGTIPADLPPTLTVLSLYGNRVGGTIPKEIGLLKNLQSLDVSYNALRGPVPVEIMQLTALEDGRSSFANNGLFTNDANVRAFLARKSNDDWESGQTVKPANVRVTATTDRSATLQWTPIAYNYYGGGYQVVASKSPGGPAAVISTTESKALDTITVRNLEPSTTYYFTVATVSHPSSGQDNLIVSDFTDAVSATTTQRVIAPPEIVVTEATTGLVQIGGVAANEDSFTLTNFGDSPANLTITKDDFFTLEADAITIAGGASRTIKVRSVPKEIGTYYGGAYVIGEGASEGIYVPVVLLSVAKPIGTVIAEALDTRIEIAGVAGAEQVGTARFRNSGTARLSGIVIADQPWVVPSPEPITIDPGQTTGVNFKIVRSRRPQSEGALTATLSLVYVDGDVGQTLLSVLGTKDRQECLSYTCTFQGSGSSNINITNVTIVDLTKPPVTAAPFGIAPAGEVAYFIPGVASLLRASGAFGSDLSILNSSASRSISDLRLYFSLAGGAASVATMQPLPSNQTVTLTNVVANVYNAAQGVGTVQVRSAAGENLAVLAKMSSLKAAGTFSGEMPVFRADRSIPAPEKLYLTGLRRTTDLIVQETSGTAARVLVELLDANGAAAAPAATHTIAPLAMLELPNAAPANAVSAIITNVAGSGGRIVAFARVTDDATGDIWSIVDWSRQNRFALTEPMRVPLAQRQVAAPGRGKRRAVQTDALSQSGATDLTLFNPTTAEVKALVQVISANGRTDEREVILGAMSTTTLVNAVTTSDAATAHIVITPLGRNAQVVVTARTRIGSAGTAVPVVGALEGLRIGQARSFAGLDDSTSATIAAASPATFTTSYGFVETAGEPVRVRARLFLDKERAIVTATVYRDFDLPARGQLVLPEVVRSFAGDTRDASFGDLHNLRLQIEVIEGKGAIVPFVVVTDNGSGDALMRIQ